MPSHGSKNAGARKPRDGSAAGVHRRRSPRMRSVGRALGRLAARFPACSLGSQRKMEGPRSHGDRQRRRERSALGPPSAPRRRRRDLQYRLLRSARRLTRHRRYLHRDSGSKWYANVRGAPAAGPWRPFRAAGFGRHASSQKASEKKKLRESGASVVEMEAAAVARASEDLNVPFYCIRAVSDLANEDFANDFNKYLMPDGRFHIVRLVCWAPAPARSSVLVN